MKKYALVMVLIILTLVFSACNVKLEDFNEYFEQSIQITQKENYHTEFELIEYIAKDTTGLTGSVEYSIEYSNYVIAYQNGEYYCKITKDGKITERWVYLDNDKQKLLTKKNGAEDEGRDFDEQEDSINLIADFLIEYSTLTDKDILQREGIKRLGFDILKVKSEYVQVVDTDKDYRQKIGKDSNNEYKYYWHNIRSAEKETINLTIRDKKIELLEAVVEYVEQRPTPPGQIAITDKYVGLIVRRMQIEAKIQYGEYSIPVKC